MMTPSPIANAADYADALITARRAKNWLFVLLLIMVLAQLALFFTARYRYQQVFGAPPPAPAQVADVPATKPTTAPAEAAPISRHQLMVYAVGATDFLGIVFAVLLMVVLLLIVNVMLVGRAIGVASVTSAFVWSVLLAFLLFPWQAFLNHAGMTDPTWKIPGILYNFDELVRSANFESKDFWGAYLKWTRFVAGPVIGIIILLMIQAKSSRGLRLALGEAEAELPEQVTGA